MQSTTAHSDIIAVKDPSAYITKDRQTRRGKRVGPILHLADERAPGYDRLWEDLLEDLQERGATMGPISPDPPPGGAAPRRAGWGRVGVGQEVERGGRRAGGGGGWAGGSRWRGIGGGRGWRLHHGLLVIVVAVAGGQ